MAAESGKTGYQPGETVPRSGIYRVVHGQHRAPHENSFLRGETFPICQTCGDDVKFEFLQGEAHQEDAPNA